MEEKQTEKEKGEPLKRKFIYINAGIRVWCAITLIVLWFVTVETIKNPAFKKHIVTWYLFVIAIIMTVLEGIWVIKHAPCFRENGCCYSKCWKNTLTVSRWKGIFYILLAIPAYFVERSHVGCIVGGTMLLVSGVLFILWSMFPLFYRKKSKEKYVVKSPRVKLITQEMSKQIEDDSFYSRGLPPKYEETPV